MNFNCWPTVAASRIAAYRPATAGIPSFDSAFVVITLKRCSLYRVPLPADGQSLADLVERYLNTVNRSRDLAISPVGKTILIPTAPGALPLSADGRMTDKVTHSGAILVFTYAGQDPAVRLPCHPVRTHGSGSHRISALHCRQAVQADRRGPAP